jgi:folate-binding protein YgfZ
VVSASGPEAETYLQGQLSQDVAALGDGGSAWSWLLAPNGKVDALLRVTRVGPEEWLLDTDAGWGEAVLARLARFKLRTKVELAPSRLLVVGLRGPGWDIGSFPEAVVAAPWPGGEGVDVIVPEASLAALGTRPSPIGLSAVGEEEEEAERIRAGIPKMGADLDERTIPAETGLVSLTVSFTKGCYTGQELVARIDSRGGNVARHLRGLRRSGAPGDGSAPPVLALPAELLGPDGAPAGTLTSAASFPSGEWVGLGYVRRAVDPAAELAVAAADLRLRQVELEV